MPVQNFFIVSKSDTPFPILSLLYELFSLFFSGAKSTNPVNALLESVDFVGGFETIAFEAPEMSESFLHTSFVHMDKSTKQRNIASANSQLN